MSGSKQNVELRSVSVIHHTVAGREMLSDTDTKIYN